MKNFKLKPDEITGIALGYGGCLATDMITVDGLPVMYMYRENSHRTEDSGWRFFAGHETDEYMKNSESHSVYDVNTIANYDPTIVPFLDAPVGSQFEKDDEGSEFSAVSND